MFGLDTVLTSVTEKVKGGDQGQRIRQRTLLLTDRLVVNLIILVPLALMGFAKIFNSSLFTVGSLKCTYPQYKHGNEIIGLTTQGQGFGNRFYMWQYCWERPQSYTPNSEEPDRSIVYHKNFPYVVLVLVTLGTMPLVAWTFYIGPLIKPEVELFGEFVEAVVKFLFRAVKEHSQNDFEYYRKANSEKVTGQFIELAKFMKSKSKASTMKNYLLLFRLFSFVMLVLISILVYVFGIRYNNSTYRCKIRFDDGADGIQYVQCAVDGVAVRVCMCWIWIVSNALLAAAVLVGTFVDLRQMSSIHKRHSTIDLFKIVWPSNTAIAYFQDLKLDDIENTPGSDDLKYIMVLAQKNLKGNVFIKAAYTFLKRARKASITDADFKVKFLQLVRQIMEDHEKDTEVKSLIENAVRRRRRA